MLGKWWPKQRGARQNELGDLEQYRALVSYYLAATLPMISQTRMNNQGVRPACCLFILGIVDMIRQVNSLDRGQFLTLFEAELADHQLAPQCSIEKFVELAGRAAQTCDVVDHIIREGASSIRAYVTHREAEAPLDLGRVVVYAEKNASQLITALAAGSGT